MMESIFPCQYVINWSLVLDLHDLGMKMLPRSVCKLIHPRYLDLSGNNFEFLPKSLTKLWNLQTLKLCSCVCLRRLPKSIRKLLNLRHLQLSDNFSLTSMPPVMVYLTSLVTLSYFVVGGAIEPCAFDRLKGKDKKPMSAQLCDLNALNELRGTLSVEIRGKLQDPFSQARAANFKAKHGIVELKLHLNGRLETFSKHDENLLEGLQALPPNLNKLGIESYGGKTLPGWLNVHELRSLNLVDIELKHCARCQHLPSFSQLPFLRRLCIEHVPKVEYMEFDDFQASSSSEAPLAVKLFFPSLEILSLSHMSSLKGWWRKDTAHTEDGPDTDTETASSWPLFGNLTKLSPISCPSLKSMPHCPATLEELKLVEVGKELTPLKLMAVSVAASSSTSLNSQYRLTALCTCRVKDLIKLPRDCLQNLSSLEILKDGNLLELSIVREAFDNLYSIKILKIEECNVMSVFGALECLKTLEKLEIIDCNEHNLYDDGSLRTGMPWTALNNLQVLVLESIHSPLTLPDGLQHLTALQYLNIGYCCLEALPEWISSFTLLQYLGLRHCYKLTHLPEGIRDITSSMRLEIVHCHLLTKRC